jgi:endonuclease/exonuclease/phosphatase family metal-dependent hydrolase
MYPHFARAFFVLSLAALAGAVLTAATDGEVDKSLFNTPLVGSFAHSSPSGPGLGLVSWNIDRGYEVDRVIGTLRDKKPDICLLQEVDLHARRTQNRDVAHDLAQALGYNYAFGTEFQELSQDVNEQPAYTGQATLSRWPILKARVLRFERQSSWWKPHSVIPNIGFFQRRLGGRIALATDLSVNGTLVVVYNLHLESRSGGAIQGAQLNEVLADLQHYPPGTPAIIGGDLNSKYNPVAVRHFLEKQGFQSVLGDRLARTHVLIGFFDWIFYRGPWQVEQGTVLRGTHASDHDPIVAELTSTGTAPTK